MFTIRRKCTSVIKSVYNNKVYNNRVYNESLQAYTSVYNNSVCVYHKKVYKYDEECV
jgi:hypothetical protein